MWSGLSSLPVQGFSQDGPPDYPVGNPITRVVGNSGNWWTNEPFQGKKRTSCSRATDTSCKHFTYTSVVGLSGVRKSGPMVLIRGCGCAVHCCLLPVQSLLSRL